MAAGVAGGADVILIPEIPYDINAVAECIQSRDHWGARFSIVVVAEGARPKDGQRTLLEEAHGGTLTLEPRAGAKGARATVTLPTAPRAPG